jgi:hypothetical protein
LNKESIHMNNISNLRVTTAEDRVEERRVAKMRMAEMVLDEDWTGMLDAMAELRRRLTGTRLPTERWGDRAAIRERVDLALSNIDAPVPDGLEDAAVTMHYCATGTQLRVVDVDTGQRIIGLSNVTGVSVYYRWYVRVDGHGFRFENTDKEGNAL